jgi:hypothetical protein
MEDDANDLAPEDRKNFEGDASEKTIKVRRGTHTARSLRGTDAAAAARDPRRARGARAAHRAAT